MEHVAEAEAGVDDEDPVGARGLLGAGQGQGGGREQAGAAVDLADQGA